MTTEVCAHCGIEPEMASHRVWFNNDVKYFPSLLKAMEHRKTLLLMGVKPYFVFVEERYGFDWVPFDAEHFLDGLARLLAPAKVTS